MAQPSRKSNYFLSLPFEILISNGDQNDAKGMRVEGIDKGGHRTVAPLWADDVRDDRGHGDRSASPKCCLSFQA